MTLSPVTGWAGVNLHVVSLPQKENELQVNDSVWIHSWAHWSTETACMSSICGVTFTVDLALRLKSFK